MECIKQNGVNMNFDESGKHEKTKNRGICIHLNSKIIDSPSVGVDKTNGKLFRKNIKSNAYTGLSDK